MVNRINITLKVYVNCVIIKIEWGNNYVESGDNRWYEKYVPKADALYDQHLIELKSEGLIYE